MKQADIVVEQALFVRPDNDEPRLAARSPGFLDGWQQRAEELVVGFGDRPANVKCPQAVFVQSLGRRLVAVVQVRDFEIEGRAGLGFFMLIFPRKQYVNFLGDPFELVERLPADWQAAVTLPTRSLPVHATSQRTVSDVQRVLKRIKGEPLREDEDPTPIADSERSPENSDSPALLGGVQILVDGGRVVFERPNADSGMVEGLWMLLPSATRSRLFPASFAFGNALKFDAIVVPRINSEQEYDGYSGEDQAADYPEGRYEYGLQHAAETGDQQELDHLLNRRSAQETWRLGVTLLIAMAILVLASRFLLVDSQPSPPKDVERKAALAAGIVAVGDPLTAATLIDIGNKTYRPQEQK